MSNTQLSMTLLSAALLLLNVACDSGSGGTAPLNAGAPGAANYNAGSQGVGSQSGLPPSETNGFSVNGLWDFSTIDGEIVFQEWNDNGTIRLFDSDTNERNDGQNCYWVHDFTFTRSGNQFTIRASVAGTVTTYTVARNGDRLSIDTPYGPFVVGLTSGISSVDLNPCV